MIKKIWKNFRRYLFLEWFVEEFWGILLEASLKNPRWKFWRNLSRNFQKTPRIYFWWRNCLKNPKRNPQTISEDRRLIRRIFRKKWDCRTFWRIPGGNSWINPQRAFKKILELFCELSVEFLKRILKLKKNWRNLWTNFIKRKFCRNSRRNFHRHHLRIFEAVFKVCSGWDFLGNFWKNLLRNFQNKSSDDLPEKTSGHFVGKTIEKYLKICFEEYETEYQNEFWRNS